MWCLHVTPLVFVGCLDLPTKICQLRYSATQDEAHPGERYDTVAAASSIKLERAKGPQRGASEASFWRLSRLKERNFKKLRRVVRVCNSSGGQWYAPHPRQTTSCPGRTVQNVNEICWYLVTLWHCVPLFPQRQHLLLLSLGCQAGTYTHTYIHTQLHAIGEIDMRGAFVAPLRVCERRTPASRASDLTGTSNANVPEPTGR